VRRLLVVVGVVVPVLVVALNATDPMQVFMDEWKGATVVLKKPLYTFEFYYTQPGGHVGVTRVAPGKGIYYRTTMTKPSVHTIEDTDVQRLAQRARTDVGYVSTMTRPGTGQLDTKSYHRPLTVLQVITYEAGTDLVVKQVVYGGSSDNVLKFELTSPRAPTVGAVTHLFVEWPGPLSPEFAERPKVEALMAEFFERVKR
jgi:hypothetical protein